MQGAPRPARPLDRVPDSREAFSVPGYFSFSTGSQVHSLEGISQPQQTSSLTSRPHVSHGEHPQVWHMVVSFPLAGASREEVLRYSFPTNRIEKLLALMETVAADADGLVAQLELGVLRRAFLDSQ